MTDEQAQDYLAFYGYESVQDFQHAAGLTPDDDLGPITQRAMQAPRCGVTAEMERAAAGTGARDPGRDYSEDPIIYQHVGWLRQLDQETQRAEFQAAFNSWAAVCGVQGREALPGERAELDIDVRTRRQDRNLDGPGRTLAYAIVGGGLIVFDGDETWRPTGSRQPGILFRNVAAHELGHTLNFYHSRVASALLAPTYNPAVAGPVSPDDVERGLRAYGRPAPVDTPTTPPPPGGDHFTGQLVYLEGKLHRVVE